MNADAQTTGAEMELFAHPDAHWDFGVSATYVDAKITKTIADSTGTPIAGIRDGNRLPTSPQLQAALTGAFNFAMGGSLESYVRLTAQYVGSSYTQLADQEPNFGLISNAAPLPAGAAALINLGNVDGNPNTPGIDPVNIRFDAQLPSYEIVNLKWGFNTDRWEGSVYINNLLDEIAFLSVDRERGRRARVGYLTNPPRTYGVSFRMNF
jgi:iron complex outermembrane receptor protein